MTNEKFKIIRLYLGITQAEFASMIGIPTSTVSKIEANCTKLTQKNIARVLREFDTQAPDFIAFTQRMEA